MTRPIVFGSVCSGIEAASVAWHPLGWRAAWLAEIDKFPSAVLAHHYPSVPNLGDFTTIRPQDHEPIDLLVGGTPCQSFSVAGLRGGLTDARGNLALAFMRLAALARPRWLVWENVPGVLSSNGGRDFGSILGALVELGYGFAYRVLDAKNFEVPQRRRRVFVVGYLGDGGARRAAEVLFEPESLRRDTQESRAAGQGTTHDVAPCIGGSGRGFSRVGDPRGQDAVVAVGGGLAHSLRADGFDASEDGTGRGTPLVAFDGNNTAGPIRLATAVNAHGGGHGRLDFESETFIAFQAGNLRRGAGSEPNQSVFPTLKSDHGRGLSDQAPCIAFSGKDYGADAGALEPTLRAMGHSESHANAGGQVAVAYDLRGREGGSQFEGPHDTANLRSASGGSSRSYVASAKVRRLTPTECEALQGFTRNYTLVPYRNGMAADGPRYKSLGNSFAVPCVRWIGERIARAGA